MNSPIDLDYVRQQFPALAGSQVFLDNAGGSLTLRRVVDRISEYLLETDVQLGATYRVSAAASERYSAARARMADYMNAAAPEEIVFGPNTTILLKLLAHAMSQVMEPGDEVIVSRVDHEANIGCWLGLEAAGAVIRFWDRNAESGDLELADLEAMLNERTRLVAVTHTSNILGTINPIRQISQKAHEVGAWVVVDGVAFAPHRAIDVRDLGADFYVFSLYKVYGPHHAVMHGKKEALLEVGSANHFFFENDHIPGKLEPGNANYELSWGSTGIVDYFEELGSMLSEKARGRWARDLAWQAVASHEEALAERFLAFLRSRDDVRVLGISESNAKKRLPTISFVHDRHASSQIVTQMDSHDIGIRYGHFYALRLIRDLGLDENEGVVRVSMVHYNTLEEIDRLVTALQKILDQ